PKRPHWGESSALWVVIDVGSGEARFAGMTALGHNRAPVQCPLCPRKRTCAVHWSMSALGQKRTHALQQIERPPQSGLSKNALRCTYASQPGHSDRPVQDPRVKLARTFVVPAATSSASSKTSEKSISSCAFGAISVMALVLWLRPCPA